MSRLGWNLLAALALFTGFSALDLMREDEAISFYEFVTEDAWPWALLSVALVMTVDLALRFRRSQSDRAALVNSLDVVRAEGARWRAAARNHSEGLASAIRAQFDDWRLSASEADVAMLMLKGLSHKEVARLRHASPATVRQQAAAIYQKSGLASRAELAAYFLEDLFPSADGKLPELRAAHVNGAVTAVPISHLS